jgi:CRP-like cAMP-binding protein
MNLTTFFSNISRHIRLNESSKNLFASTLNQKTFKKGSVLLEEGQSAEYLFFVNSGLLRAYCLSPKGKESTIMFAWKDWWITDMYCFLNQKPSMVYIEVMKDAELLLLSHKNLQYLFENFPEFNQFFRILMQNAYCREQLRMIQNLTLPAKERYELFISKYPKVLETVPLKYIASYVGMTPEFLSSLRSKKEF